MGSRFWVGRVSGGEVLMEATESRLEGGVARVTGAPVRSTGRGGMGRTTPTHLAQGSQRGS